MKERLENIAFIVAVILILSVPLLIGLGIHYLKWWIAGKALGL